MAETEAPESLDRGTAPSPDAARASDEPEHVRGRGKHERSRGRRFIGSTPFLVFVALAIAILVKTFLIQAFYIPSESMQPTLAVGDRVFVNKIVYDVGDIHRFDVIVFESPDGAPGPDRGIVGGVLHWLGEGIGVAQPAHEDFIKRVIGLPGETVEIRDNVVYVNGTPIDEPYLTDEARRQNGDFPPFEVPEDSLFVMGDNRSNSADSRYGLGYVPVERVIGKAFVVIWPPSHLGGLG
jgi:signal peptidase I